MELDINFVEHVVLPALKFELEAFKRFCRESWTFEVQKPERRIYEIGRTIIEHARPHPMISHDNGFHRRAFGERAFSPQEAELELERKEMAIAYLTAEVLKHRKAAA